MRETILHYMPLYSEYIRVFGSSLPHVKITQLPHEAQQQLNFMYILQLAKDAGFINTSTYYVPLKQCQGVLAGADGLILDSYMHKGVSVQHKYLTKYTELATLQMIQDYAANTGIFNITVDTMWLKEQYVLFFQSQVLPNMHLYLDVHSNAIDEMTFTKALSTTENFLLQKNYGNISNYEHINNCYRKNTLVYMAANEQELEYACKIKQLFVTEL